MTTIDMMLRAAKQINTKSLVKASMKATSDEYIKVQREQMFEGYLSDGNVIQRLGEFYRGYAAYTKMIKSAKGQPFDHVTLYDTGSFQQKIFAIVNDQGFGVGSYDEKSEMLQDDYGPKIFGLNSMYRLKYADVLIDKMRQNFIIGMNNRVRSKQAA